MSQNYHSRVFQHKHSKENAILTTQDFREYQQEEIVHKIKYNFKHS